MAPACQGDESFEQHIEALVQSRVDIEVIATGVPIFSHTITLSNQYHMQLFVQVGLLIGRSGNSGRDIVLMLLPTPHVSSCQQLSSSIDDIQPSLTHLLDCGCPCTGWFCSRSFAAHRRKIKQKAEETTVRSAGTDGCGVYC